MTARSFWRVTFFALAAFATWGTLTPDPDHTKSAMSFTKMIAQLVFGDSLFGDKVAHFITYGVLGGGFAWSGMHIFGKRWGGVVALALYGLFLERLQAFTGVREPDLLDAVANSIGAMAGFSTGLVLERTALYVRGSARV